MQDIPSDFSAKGIFRHAHFSTVYPALFRRTRVFFHRKRIPTPDNDFFDADLLQNSVSNKHLILLHGLEGNSLSGYIQSAALHFFNKGLNIHALNFRSCSGEPNNLTISYHSGFTTDLRFYIQQLIQQNANTEIYLCAFSLGGNVMLKYLAEESDNISGQILSACVVSAPVHLQSSAFVLAKKSNTIYMQRFLKSLSAKIKMKAKMFPRAIDITGIDHIKNFLEFDDRYTAPLHGFKNAVDYWERCSSAYVLHHIKTPTLLINAQNDPFLSPECFPEASNSNLFFEYPRYGGHVGFQTSFWKSDWLNHRIEIFFNI